MFACWLISLIEQNLIANETAKKFDRYVNKYLPLGSFSACQDMKLRYDNQRKLIKIGLTHTFRHLKAVRYQSFAYRYLHCRLIFNLTTLKQTPFFFKFAIEWNIYHERFDSCPKKDRKIIRLGAFYCIVFCLSMQFMFQLYAAKTGRYTCYKVPLID